MGRPGARPATRSVPVSALICLSFLIVWLWIDPSLLYSGDGSLNFPTFAVGLEFLSNFLSRPGGPIEYLAAFLSQGYYYGWAGALIITFLGAALGCATHVFLTEMSGTRVPSAWALPGLFLLFLCCHYKHEFATLAGQLAALLAVCVYLRSARSSRWPRPAIFVCLSVPLYYTAGGAFILFALLCAVAESTTRRGLVLTACYLLLAAGIPYGVGVLAMGAKLTTAYLRLTPFHPVTSLIPPGGVGRNTVLSLDLLLLTLGIAAVLWRRIPRVRAAPQKSARSPRSGPAHTSGGPSDSAQAATPPRRPSTLSVLRRLVGSASVPVPEAIAVVIASVVVILSTQHDSRTGQRRIIRHACQEQWPELLEEARDLRADAFNFLIQNAVTRALYETGRLPNEMFSFPQHHAGYMLAWGKISDRSPSALSQPAAPGPKQRKQMDLSTGSWTQLRRHYFVALGDLELQLGLANQAEHQAHEALEVSGDHPLVLRRLARINLAKGQIEAARVYLRALSKYLNYGDYAEGVLRRLEDETLLVGDSQIARIRSVMVESRAPVDFVRGLEEVVGRDGQDRMAFEYLMAFYLLNLSLNDVVDRLEDLGKFGYSEIPRHYQEAIVIYESVSGKKVDIPGLEVDPHTRQAHLELTRTYAAQFRLGDRPEALKALKERFGDTYFYYFLREAEGTL